MADINRAVTAILARREEMPARRSLLVGVTGIDSAGKGHLTEEVVTRLCRRGSRAEGINADGWLNLPHIRFNEEKPAEHFYRYAIRFDEMFHDLILPLRENRSHDITVDFTEETTAEYRRHRYQFEDVDIIVLEGIFLLKRAYRSYFDLSIWVDCSFETALERALRRSQEGLPAADTVRTYESIYFPAQKIHFARDNPRAFADLIINNDPRSARCSVPAGQVGANER